ncbi:hypothetical protein LCM10_04660 [Rossellomorea aquimaris]|uniref:hypothetical protein n=1 Tax=Rossellomorea aquimaris TaxID=189382 RepID=UPI001CD376FD|nr:hypothetical protein [Rossellomorea aquimaris]MCA1054270.1 hypothetical protein [Rossellomorea aquimaris]
MENNRIDLEYPLQERDYMSLFMNSPTVKSLKWYVLGGMLILIPIFHLLMSILNTSTNREQVEIWDPFSIVLIFFLYIVTSLVGLRRLKSKARIQGKANYERLYGGRHFLLTYDRAEAEFFLRKQQVRVPVNKNLSVYSTTKNYFFYSGKGMNGAIFLIPKDGSEQHKVGLQAILDDLTMKKGMEIREMEV